MAGGTEYIILISAVVAGALIIPMMLDDGGISSITNGICTILVPPLNFTCNEPQGNVTFAGLNGIEIFVNPAISNTTVFWNFTGSAGNGTGGTGNFTHVSISVGDGDVFKEEFAGEARFRGIVNGTGLDMIVNGSDISLSIKRCDNTGLVFFNATSQRYQCVTTEEFVSNVIFDNNEFFPPHLSVGGGADSIVDFSNYSARAIKMRSNFNEDSSWLFIVPQSLNVTNVDFQLLWFSDVGSGTGTICFELSTNLLQEGSDMDSAFNQRVEQCEDATPYGADELQVTNWTITPVESQINAGDIAILKLERRAGVGGNLNDTFNKDAYVVGGEIEWAGTADP